MTTLRAALPIAAVLFLLSAAAAFAGNGDMGVLAAVQTPATQAQNAWVYIGTIAAIAGIVGAAIMYFKDHNLVHAAIAFISVALGVVIIKNAIAWVTGIGGGASIF